MSRCNSEGISPDVLDAMMTSGGALLEFQLLGDVLLDEIDAARHRTQVGGERQRALGRQRRKGQSRQCALGIFHRAANPGLHLRFHVRRHDIDTEMQCARRPAAADHSGTEQTQRFHLSHSRHASRPSRLGFYNVTVII
jgi:hypothetical protein